MRTLYCLFAFTALASVATAQQTPISLSGYNQDLIAETGRTEAAVADQVRGGTTTTTDDIYVFYETGLGGSPSGTGLASDGTIVSAERPSTTFQLAAFKGAAGATSNNALLLNGATSGTLTFATPKAYTNLSFLASGFNSSISTTYTLNFSDGTSTSGTYTVKDNFNGSGYAIQNLGRVSRNDSGTPGYQAGGNPRLYDDTIALSSADSFKALTSVTFLNNNATSRNRVGVFGISGTVNPVPEPASMAALGLGVAAFLRRRKKG